MNPNRSLAPSSTSADCAGTEDRSETSDSPAAAIVFFDGVCGFCNHSVNFLMARDADRQLRFAPLQGQTAEQRLPADLRQNLDSLVFVSNGRTYLRSAAVVRILKTLGGKWALAGTALWLVPLPVRDLGYRVIARIRYRLFGRRESCRLPKPEERDLILD